MSFADATPIFFYRSKCFGTLFIKPLSHTDDEVGSGEEVREGEREARPCGGREGKHIFFLVQLAHR